MSNSKILPFDCNVVYSIDCRISCRLGIIQASPYGQAWLATHLDVLMSNNLDINFGSGIYVAQMSYYDDILDTREIDFFFIHKVIKQIHVEEAFTNPAELRNRITRTNHKISCKTK